jgi:predicted aspartyl protease
LIPVTRLVTKVPVHVSSQSNGIKIVNMCSLPLRRGLGLFCWFENASVHAVKTLHRSTGLCCADFCQLAKMGTGYFPATSTASKSHLGFSFDRADYTCVTASLGPLERLGGPCMAHAAKTLAMAMVLSCCAASALAASDTTANNTLRVRIIGNQLMVVSVSINDRGPFEFLVDTGTNTTLIDPALATELSLKPKDTLQLASLASSTKVSRYYLQTFRVGPASVSSQEALAVPLPQLAAIDHRVRGVLGMNFLLHFSFRLDYESRSLELYPFPETARVPAGLRVPVAINESRLLIQVASSAAPRGSWKLALDSGISQFLVFQDRIDHVPASDDCRRANCLMKVSTNLAEQSAATVVLHDVSIADAHLPDTQVVVLRNDLQKPSDPQDGLLPAALFHSVFFDRTNATVIFSPSPGTVSMAGIQLR